MYYIDSIRHPIITEKATILSEQNKTVFKVHNKATLDDIIVDKKPFEELFVEQKNDQKWKFKSASSDKEYTVRYNAAGKLSCDCWGYIAHKRCKHIKQVEDELLQVS